MQTLANTIEARHIPMLRTVLLAMLAAGADQEWPGIGVCGNLGRRLQAQFKRPYFFGYDACVALAESWPHALRLRDGRLKDFFVPSDRDPTDCSYVEYEQLWEGPQLARRIDLMKHLLTQLGLLEQYYQSLKEESDAV